jgi:hypothetical protein
MLTVTLGKLIILHHNVLSAREEGEQPAGNLLRLLLHHVVSAVFDDPAFHLDSNRLHRVAQMPVPQPNSDFRSTVYFGSCPCEPTWHVEKA